MAKETAGIEISEEGRSRVERVKDVARKEPTPRSIGELEAMTRAWLDRGMDGESLLCLNELVEGNESLAALRLQKALRRTSETVDGQRLCTALAVGPFPPGAKVSRQALEKAESMGIKVHEHVFSAVALARMTYSERLELAKALHDGESLEIGEQGIAPMEMTAGSRAVCLVAMLPGEARGGWDESDPKLKRMALESLREIAERMLEGSHVSAQAAGELDEIVSRRERMAGPALLAERAKAASKASMTPMERLAASASLHFGKSGDPEFWRVAIRGRKAGFLLDGMDIALDGGDPEEVFREIAAEMAGLGMQLVYRIQGAYQEDMCPTCDKPIYPTPDDPDWKKAFAEAGMPINGSHRH